MPVWSRSAIGGIGNRGVGVGFDDVAAEHQSVDNGRAELGIGERFGPPREGLVASDGRQRRDLNDPVNP
jgi:hypothetical protein